MSASSSSKGAPQPKPPSSPPSASYEDALSDLYELTDKALQKYCREHPAPTTTFLNPGDPNSPTDFSPFKYPISWVPDLMKAFEGNHPDYFIGFRKTEAEKKAERQEKQATAKAEGKEFVDEEEEDNPYEIPRKILDISSHPHLLYSQEKQMRAKHLKKLQKKLFEMHLNYLPEDFLTKNFRNLFEFKKFLVNNLDEHAVESAAIVLEECENALDSIDNRFAWDWKRVCKVRAPFLGDSETETGWKTLFINHHLEKWLIKTQGQFSMIPLHELCFILDNGEYVNKLDLRAYPLLTDQNLNTFIDNFPNIVELDISRCDRLTADNMLSLVSLTRLRTLKLCGGTQSVKTLENILALKKLTSLSLNAFNLEGKLGTALVNYFSKLESLSLIKGSYDNETIRTWILPTASTPGIQRLAGLDLTSHLTREYIFGEGVSVKSLLTLAQGNPKLETLNLCSAEKLDDTNMSKLANILSSLKHLNMRATSNCGEGMLELVKGNNLTLQTLILNTKPKNPTFLPLLAKATCNLRYFEGPATALFAHYNPGLQAINHYDKAFNDDLLKQIVTHAGALEGFSFLKTKKLTGKGFQILGEKCPQLKQIQLMSSGDRNFPESDFIDLLEACPNLRYIGLRNFDNMDKLFANDRVLKYMSKMYSVALYHYQNTQSTIRILQTLEYKFPNMWTVHDEMNNWFEQTSPYDLPPEIRTYDK